MLEENVQLVLDRIRPDDVVLDIGGWARPFNRADFVLDAMPYETRGYYGASLPAQGGTEERFRESTWIERDICGHLPLPFADKSVDFVICSHTLEDIRDPIWVCQEMVRIGKRGYIEVPSRLAESSRGIEPGIVGWSHHRWLVDVSGSRITFRMKYHMIHGSWQYSLPASYVRRLPEAQHVQWLLWEGGFEFSEVCVHGLDRIADELKDFVRRTRPYPRWMLLLDRWREKGVAPVTALLGRVARLARRAGGR